MLTYQLAHMGAMLFVVVAIVFAVAGVVYALLRFLEAKGWYSSLVVAGVSLGSTGFLLVLSGLDASYALTLVWLIVCCAIGSWFHQASGGKSETKWRGFFLLYGVGHATVFLSLFAIALCAFFVPILQSFALDDQNYFHLDLVLVFAYACFTAPMAVTAFLRGFQMFKYRPGFDCHLTDDELLRERAQLATK